MIGVKHIRQHWTSWEVVQAKLDRYNDPEISGIQPESETLESPLTSTCLLVACIELKTARM
jgi:hypothetical protein